MIRKEVIIGDCRLILGDCREIISGLTFDAICADPPYGIGYVHSGGGGRLAKSTVNLKPVIGDDQPFDPRELIHVPAILWGGNHFASRLPDTPSWLVWDKRCSDFSNDQADCEMAWTNLGGPARMVRHLWNGMLRGAESKTPRVHPTQKPVAVMEWCLGFLPDARTILDPFMGSGTTLVACAKLGRKGIGIELDEGYFDSACKRVRDAYAQPDLFIPAPAKPVQEGFDLCG